MLRHYNIRFKRLSFVFDHKSANCSSELESLLRQILSFVVKQDFENCKTYSIGGGLKAKNYISLLRYQLKPKKLGRDAIRRKGCWHQGPETING